MINMNETNNAEMMETTENVMQAEPVAEPAAEQVTEEVTDVVTEEVTDKVVEQTADAVAENADDNKESKSDKKNERRHGADKARRSASRRVFLGEVREGLSRVTRIGDNTSVVTFIHNDFKAFTKPGVYLFEEMSREKFNTNPGIFSIARPVFPVEMVERTSKSGEKYMTVKDFGEKFITDVMCMYISLDRLETKEGFKRIKNHYFQGMENVETKKVADFIRENVLHPVNGMVCEDVFKKMSEVAGTRPPVDEKMNYTISSALFGQRLNAGVRVTVFYEDNNRAKYNLAYLASYHEGQCLNADLKVVGDTESTLAVCILPKKKDALDKQA